MKNFSNLYDLLDAVEEKVGFCETAELLGKALNKEFTVGDEAYEEELYHYDNYKDEDED